MSSGLLFRFLSGSSVLCVVLAISCSVQGPRAVNGYLDLSSWNFSSNPEVNLDGTWEYWWNKLYAPSDLAKAESGSPFEVPGFWNAAESDPKPVRGVATYRLRVTLPASGSYWSLSLPDIFCAYVLYINGEERFKLGEVSQNLSVYRDEIRPRVVPFYASQKTVEIVLKIANESDIFGGIRNHVVLGPEQALRTSHQTDSFFQIALVGALVSLGLLHLFIFFLQPYKKANLWLALFSFCITWRGLSTGDRVIADLFQGVPFEFWPRSEYVAVFLGVFFVSAYLRSLYRALWPERAMNLFSLYTLVFLFLVFFLPLDTYGHIFVFYEWPLVGVVTVFFTVSLLAARRRVPGAWIVVSGIFILAIGSLNDLLYLSDVVKTGFILDKLLFLFMLMQSFLLSRQMAMDFHLIELQAKDLHVVDKLKDDFLARVSHELRTPLHGILGIVESFQKNELDPLSEKQRYHMQLLDSTSKRLLTMVTSILDFSQLKKHQMTFETRPINIKQTVDFLIPFLKLRLKPTVQLYNRVSSQLPLVLGDEVRVQQVLQNLLINALKNTKEGSVAVEAETRNQTVVVHVRDSGEGIPLEKQSRLFDAFHQTEEANTRKNPGLGLGLAITKEFVQQMNGSISFVSEVGRGTTVSFVLPICPPAKAHYYQANRLEKDDRSNHEPIKIPPLPLEPKETEDGKSDRKLILIVDDEPVNLLLLRTFLGRMGYAVVEADNGVDALRVLNEKPVSLMILDVMMPGLSGFEVCVKAREHFSIRRLPILLLTAKDAREDLAKGFASGASDYMTKPFNREEIRARIEFHLKLATLTQ